MAEESSAARPKRKYTRRTTTTTSTTRRRRGSTGNELVDNLNQMIGELIKENRKLKRQVEKLSARATGAASSTVEKGLKSIQRRVQRAISSGTTTTRRRRTSTTTTSTGRRRGRPPKSESAS